MEILYRVLFQYKKKKKKNWEMKNSTNLMDRIFLKYFI